MSAMTNFRAEDMPGAQKPVAKKASKPAPTAKKAPKVEKPVVEDVVVDVVEEDAPESE